MKKRLLSILAITMAGSMVVAAGCGKSEDSKSGSSAAEESGSEKIESVADISYANINYDFKDQIQAEKEATKLVPQAADIKIAVADEKGATGVELVSATDSSNTTDYYLNALVAGNKLNFTSKDGAEIVSASSNISGEQQVKDGAFSIVPATLKAAEPVDEVITVTLKDGSSYNVHTLNEMMPSMSITGSGVSKENAGVYDFALDKFLLRVNTDGELVYYRNLGSVGELMAENFAKQVTENGSCFTYFAELHKDYRQANGGYSSGMYVVMDDNYVEDDYVTLLPNDDANHTHGEGYLDQHEFVVLGEDHYLTLSYTPELVNNLPDTVKGLNDGNTAYVWAGVFQEVKDGKVLKEINTTDYPMLYESAVEKIDYANSTDHGTTVTINNNQIPSLADGWMDYVHPNSLDYTLDKDGNVDKLLVSMRDQSAVYQFDFASGAMEWILGGKASTLTGYDNYASERKDDNGNAFNALTFGQHYVRYTNRNADGTMDGNPEISVFDNHTGSAPFITAAEIPTLTRTFKAVIDEKAKTATISDVVNGTDLNQKTDKYHIASHCGSVDYFNEDSVVIGWGLHAVIDNIGKMAPEGTIGDKGYNDLRIGSRPIFTEYDQKNDTVTFELSADRNPLCQSHEAFFSYRTYKTLDK